MASPSACNELTMLGFLGALTCVAGIGSHPPAECRPPKCETGGPCLGLEANGGISEAPAKAKLVVASSAAKRAARPLLRPRQEVDETWQAWYHW